MGWQDDIGPKTVDFLKDFGENFLKSYALAMFLKIQADVDAERAAPSTKQLKYRDWDSVSAGDKSRMEGDCWMKEGPGVGAFGGWSACYLVQLPDCNLAVYRDAKAAADQKNAKLVIRTAGYQLVREVTFHFDAQASVASTELQCDKPNVGFSSYSWSLVHGMRTNYIFQLHKGAGGGCLCLGGSKVEPADAGAENAHRAAEWSEVMEHCAGNSSPRDLKSNVVAMAFERTVKKMSSNLPELSGFTDDGSEGQILSHMVFLAVFEASCKEEILEQVRKVPIGQLTIWYKARGTAAAIIEKAVGTSWSAMQKLAEAQSERLEAKIKPLLGQILAKKVELLDMLRSKVGERIGEMVSQKLSPLLNGLLKELASPMKGGLDKILTIYETEIDSRFEGKSVSGELPPDVRAELDRLPRDGSKTEPLERAVAALVEPLARAKATGAGAELLRALQPNDIGVKCRQTLLELLDAMVFTTVEEMRDGGRDIREVKLDVLSRAKADATDALKDFVSRVFVDLCLGTLKLHTKEFVDPALESAQSLIPEDLHEIIDLDAEYNALLEATIGAAIGKVFELK